MRRPDYADQAIAAGRARAKHRHCVCGDGEPCTCGRVHTPSPGWRPWSWRPLMSLIFEYLQVLGRKLDSLHEEMTKMGAREDAADARTAELIELVRQHEAALKTENDQLRSALASADADKAAALEAESDADAGRQEAFNSALDELAGNAAPPADDSGDGSAPVDDGSGTPA